MIFKFKPDNGIIGKDEFKNNLDELKIEHVILDGKLIFSASIDQLIQLDKTFDPYDIGLYDPDEIWE